MDFVRRVNETRPAAGKVALFWLGQAGFLLKTASGQIIAIDPYFSDHVMRTENNHRLQAAHAAPLRGGTRSNSTRC